jgi:hypothetical protein
MDNAQPGVPAWLEGVRGEQVLPIINSDETIIRVEAGPGTGKTFGLVRRVQRILHPEGLNVDGQDVLVVAFNRVIAKQLKNEIMERLQTSPHNGDPIIDTAHALCLKAIGGRLRILLPHERHAMIYDILQEYPVIKKRLDFNHAKKALVNHEAGIEEDYALWQAADGWLRRHKARVISELPKLLLNKLHAGDVGDRRYKYIVVDEYQDLTPGLQELFQQLRSKYGQFMALGDPRQSIYAFLGNDPLGLSKIDTLVSPEKVLDLSMTECQRCPADVVRAANQLTILSDSSPLTPINSDAANIHLVFWKTVPAEGKGMANAVWKNIKRNPGDSHLVMVTRRAFGYILRDELSKLDSSLRIDLSFSESLLETWPVRESFLLFCLLVDPDAPTWRAWFAYSNSENGKDFKASTRNSESYLGFLSQCSDEITLDKVALLASQAKRPMGNGGKNVWDRSKRLMSLKSNINWDGVDGYTLIDSIFTISRWPNLKPELKETAQIDLELARNKTRDIFDDISSKYPLLPVIDKLQKVAEVLRYQIATKEPFMQDETADLQIMTLWGAKGVTADHVYILGLCEEAIPGERRDDYPGTDNAYFEEQRRLFYVSITRAKKTMVLSRALRIKQKMARDIGLNVRSKLAFWPLLKMCPFLNDIIGFLPRAEDGDEWNGCH